MESPPEVPARPKLRVSHLLLVLLAGVLLFLARPYLVLLEDRLSAGEVQPAAAVDPCPRVRPSRLATKYLENLHGIEIGASTQNSFDLKRSINVDFSDEQGGLWQLKTCAPAVVNIVALGDNLPFKDNTLDYVLSSHVIEHFFDPVRALKEWHRVIRPGGYIFIIAPHMDRTFDKHRESTPVAELIDRSTGKLKVSDYAQPLNQDALKRLGMDKFGVYYQVLPQRLVRDKRAVTLEEGWAYYDKDDHHHWSAWRTADFVELVKKLGYRIVETQDVDDKIGNGFTVVIRK
ncbi:MAG: class I SAM-dependent methyltransferase [Proteobacteria bacterium]|nr:class I SAM-dependent methyltransferase [Pseudomonadota bacterium]